MESIDVFVVLLAICGLGGLLPASIASKKGHSFGPWWVYGSALFLIALIHALVLGQARRCPHCAEGIRQEAKVCPHCQRDLPDLQPSYVAS